ncbi:MAG: transglycosylase SLT domain-containing protein [Alphaproteobacteria bacterium]
MASETRLLRILACLSLGLALGACTTADPKLPNTASTPVPEPSPRNAAGATPTAEPTAKTAEPTAKEARAAEAEAGAKSAGPALDSLISKYSVAYSVPESLVRRVVHRESRFNPAARNGPYWGLMQMLPATARGMGHKGSARDLLDAETNLKYGVKYLAGAYMVAGNDPDQAVRLYSRGYYYQAKRKGLLEETGLKPSPATPAAPAATAIASTAPEIAPSLPLAYAGQGRPAPAAAVPLPTGRPEGVSTAAAPTTGGNDAPGRVPAPL